MTDQKILPRENLSFASAKMLTLRNTVIEAWEHAIRSESPHATHVSRPVLIDTMPVLYDRMCDALTPEYSDRNGLDVTSIGTQHGVERANLTDFDAKTLLAEFAIFRRVVFDALDAHSVPITLPERRALHLTIDLAVQESVVAFLDEANSMREKLAGALAHDLRQPVAAISGAAEFLLTTDSVPVVHHWTRRILKNTERLTSMLSELLDSLSIRAKDRSKLTLEEIDLLILVQRVADQVAETHKANVTVSGNSVVGRWNSAAIERATENILTNAVKYGDQGSLITVVVSEDNEKAILSVHNSGVPIPREEFESIFQRFVRSDSVKESGIPSWGLGLPYVREVARAHGGSVVVFSDRQSGTTFVLDIPLDARPFQNSNSQLQH